MKRTIYILVIFLTVFLINYISVDAGICDGLKGHKYCNVGSGLKFNEISFPRYAYYLPIGFNTSDSFDGNSDVAFCIDPGLSAATENYTFFRELDINSEYDKGLYSMYQFLVNSSRASESEGKDATIYRAFFEAAARIWTVKNGNYSYSADLEKNFARFINCSNSKIDTTLIDSLSSKMKTLISKYNWAYNDETDVFKVNNETLVKSYCFEKVKNGTWNTELLKKFYEKVNVSSVWEDPFEKKSSISINQIDTKNGSNYKITFTVKFGNFFDNGVGIDSLNLDAAKFTSYIYINNKKCDINNCSSEVVNISNNYNSNIITSGNKDLIYTIELTPEQYKNLYENNGENNGKIELKYSYNHPMNLDNLYIARLESNEQAPSVQRLLGVFNYNEERVIEHKLEEPNNMCAHNGVGVYIDKIGNKVNFNTYLNTCGCNKVNEDYLDTTTLKLYSNSCKTIPKVSGNLHSCTMDNEIIDGNKIEYKYGEEKINAYCKIDCTETINFTNVPGIYSGIKAGSYLKIDYPTTLATKYCEVDVDYKSWEEAYNAALSDVISAYNIYALAKAKKDANYASPCVDTDYSCSWKENECEFDENGEEICKEVSSSGTFDTKPTGEGYSCSSYCADRDYDYRDASYTFVDSQNFTNQNIEVIKSGRYDTMQHNSNISTEKTNYENALKVLKNLLSSLKTCTTKLKNISYDYKENLQFHYEQTINNGSKLYNNDNELKLNSTVRSSGNYVLSGQKYYSFDNSLNGIITESIPMFDFYQDNYSINRTFEIENNYYIEDRYTKSFVGGFGTLSEYSNKNNLINLGPVYNIDANAIQKSDNKYYFVFKELGDDNQIYDYYSSRGEIRDSEGFNRSSSVEDLKRYCTYETINDLLCISGTGDSDCDDSSSEGLGAKILFKIVDPNNVDPNNRINQNNKGFENWKDKQSVISDIEDGDTFNPENLEYSFDLDAATIKSIRAYNDSNDYLNYDGYSCDENGNYCKSSFIDNAVNAGYLNGYRLKKPFATIVNGREQWKNFDIITKTITVEDVS